MTKRKLREEVSMQLLMADDHALFRDGFSLLLKQLEPGIRVIEAGCAKIGSIALRTLVRHPREPDGGGQAIEEPVP